MPVTTLDDLDHLAVGTLVKIGPEGNTHDWVRTAEGLRLSTVPEGGYSQPLADFRVVIDQGQVSVVDPHAGEVGQYRVNRANTNYYYLVEQDGERWVALRWHPIMGNWTWTRLSAVDLRRQEPVTPDQEWPDTWRYVCGAARLAHSLRQEATEAHDREVPAVIPQDFIDDLHQVHGELDDRDDMTRLNRVLGAHGVGVMVDIEVTVDVSGRHNPSRQEQADLIGAPDASWVDNEDECYITWSYEITVTKRGAGCMCETVDLDDIRPLLPTSVDPDDVTWDVENCTGE